jgi:hypothetical protein
VKHRVIRAVVEKRRQRVAGTLERGEARPKVAPRIIPSRPRLTGILVPMRTRTAALAVSSKRPTATNVPAAFGRRYV